jgi:AraC-like DNA-binding protein
MVPATGISLIYISMIYQHVKHNDDFHIPSKHPPIQILRNHAALRTRDPDELRQWLRLAFAVRALDMPDRGRQFCSVVNHCPLSSLDLTFVEYGGAVALTLSQLDFFAQGIPVSGAGHIWLEGQDAIVGIDHGSAVGPGNEIKLNYGSGFKLLAVKFSPQTLSAKLAAMIGGPVDPPLVLAGPKGIPDLIAAHSRLVRYLSGELENGLATVAPLLVAELEQAVLVSFLQANLHNYSHHLQGTPRAAAPWQVRRAVDYIEANWDQPIMIEDLCAVSQTSARSLFYLFRRTCGYSPMVHANHVRLRHAHNMLMQPSELTTVTTVGFACGFSNLGNFALKYRQAFGEKPSETLRNNK